MTPPHPIESLNWRRLRYERWQDESEGWPRGTVRLPDGAIVPGYPSIGRILDLRAGVRTHFGDAPFWVEEKVDGYNVRVVRWRKQLLAFTRGGFLCPYTTDRVRRWIPAQPFLEHPDLVLCLEVAGPETPYAEHGPSYLKEDARPFAFDAMQLNRQGFWPRERFYALVDRYGIPTVERLGRFSLGTLDRLLPILARYEEERREGFVLKPALPGSQKRYLKYTTAASAIDDLRVGAPWLADLPAEYFTNRLLRLALALCEEGLDRKRHAEDLGKALLGPLTQAIAEFAQTRHVAHTYRCRLHTKTAALELMRHLKRHGKGRVRRRKLFRGEDGMWHLVFEREAASMSGILGHLLAGGAMFD